MKYIIRVSLIMFVFGIISTPFATSFSAEESLQNLGNIDPQTHIPTYGQNDYITNTELGLDSGVDFEGDVDMVNPNVPIDTSTVGDGQTTDVLINYIGLQSVEIEYNVAPEMVVTNQTTVPTYEQGAIVTPSTFAEDSGIQVTGGLDPIHYEFTNGDTLRTDRVGHHYAEIVIFDSCDQYQLEVRDLQYDVV